MTEPNPKPLNRLEVWIAEHSAPIFVCLALLIVLAAIAVFYTFQQAGEAKRQVDVLRPQVTRVVKGAVVCSLDASRGSQESRRCALRLRVALVNCRRYPRCREALLLAIASPTPTPGLDAPPALPTRHSSSGGGDALLPPSNHGHQPPGPATGPPAATPPTTSPAPSPGVSGPPGNPEAPGKGPAEDKPGNPSPGPPSGAGVEVCALERCVGAEVDLNPKGLLP